MFPTLDFKTLDAYFELKNFIENKRFEIFCAYMRAKKSYVIILYFYNEYDYFDKGDPDSIATPAAIVNHINHVNYHTTKVGGFQLLR